ncbi:MAG: hypothetical protein KAF91_14715 [Nostoc sp. TH1S01]|nr:hypothetical protein [Nostoc sp. TH1S01]
MTEFNLKGIIKWVFSVVAIVVPEKAEEKQVSYKMFLPESLRARFKSICALKGVSMNEVLLQLVQNWVEENENISAMNRSKADK